MQPRPYRLQQRQLAIDETRARVVAAARDCLAAAAGAQAFTLDAVARAAGVTRTTVYNQFGGRRGLLEAVCDDVAQRGGIVRLDDIFADPDPLQSLRRYVGAFVALYDADRLLFRRLFALAAIDDEFGAVLHERADRRREGLRYIVKRIHATDGRASRAALDEQTLVLKALLNFELFDTLRGDGMSVRKIAAHLQALAVAAVQAP